MTFKKFKHLVAMDQHALTRQGNRHGLLIRLMFDFDTKVLFFFRLCTYLKSKMFQGLGLYYIVLILYRHIMNNTGIQLLPTTSLGGGCVYASQQRYH